jgi:thiosulfate reductase cytochrome b subunit
VEASVVEAAAVAEPPATVSAHAVPAAPPAAPAAQPAVALEKPVRPKAEPRLYGSRTLAQWIKRVVLLALGAVAAAGILVLAARGVTTLPGVPAFLERYPGEYHLPATAESGFPWWAQWTHFLNIFLMVLIIRSGYQVRTEQKPPAFWTPKRGGKRISINLWLHQSLDILWLANGLIFVVLLFASGRWLRIVPTSWEVFPNALSALLQYMTLDWPVENGWVNYNSLQQLMYFIVVFIAAPLAAITGARMSEFWPKDAKTLNRIYPVEAARALHFPTMLFFVLFILIHVFLVFATGALRNLNHMFGGTDVVNWVGFWLFAAAIAITAAGWYAARPLVLAPIAKLFGQVSSR